VFPCIVLLRKPLREEPEEDRSVRVVEFPREALSADIATYVRENAHTVPRKRFGKNAWSLETSDVDDLMEKIRHNGVPLAEFAGVKPYRGVLTGLNEAFLIDTPTKDRLVREDPRSAEIIKPYLRGQDIKRWSPEWRGLWIIVLKSSGDHLWPWTDAEDAEEAFRRTYPSLCAHLKSMEEKLRRRSDHGRHWWELRTCTYYDAFEHPKILWKDLAFHSAITFEPANFMTNDLCFILPSENRWLLTVLNSPIMWAYMWRNVMHGKDEVLRLKNIYTEKLPIAPATDEAQDVAEEAVGRLISLTRSGQEARRDTLDWLRVEFGVEKTGQKLEDFASIGPDAFVEEVRKRRPRGEGRLTPGALRDLKGGYAEMAEPVRKERSEAAGLERRLSDLVNEAYGLTGEEVDLMWKTAPPRMPRF